MFCPTRSLRKAPFKPIRRIVALGDIHGDLKKAHEILRASGIINRELEWQESSKDHHNGLPTKFVQTGDLVHRGPDDLPVMDFFMDLRAQSGGQEAEKVVLLLGNHEEMMGWGSADYISSKSEGAYLKAAETKELKGAVKQLMTSEAKYGRFIRSLPVAHLDGQTVFNHAGLDPKFVNVEDQEEKKHTPADLIRSLNAQASRDWKRGKKGYGTPLADPVWNRDIYSNARSLSCTKDLDKTLTALGAKRMVVGHTPTEKVITQFANGRIIGIDISMSCGMYNRSPETLEILVDEEGNSTAANAITVDGKRRELPPSKVHEHISFW